jgi:hypothetical protein
MEEIDRWQTDENDIAPPSIFAHLLVGMIVGFLSAALALLVGFGFWGTLGAYSLGGVVGFSASTIVLMATHTQ